MFIEFEDALVNVDRIVTVQTDRPRIADGDKIEGKYLIYVTFSRDYLVESFDDHDAFAKRLTNLRRLLLPTRVRVER